MNIRVYSNMGEEKGEERERRDTRGINMQKRSTGQIEAAVRIPKGLILRVAASPRNFPCGARTAALRKFIRENVRDMRRVRWMSVAIYVPPMYAGRLANGCGRGGRKRTITFGSPRTRVPGVVCARQLCQKRRRRRFARRDRMIPSSSSLPSPSWFRERERRW